MKIDHGRLEVERRSVVSTTVVPQLADQPASKNFAAVLHRQRQRETIGHQDSRRPEDGRARRTVSRHPAQSDAGRRAAGHAFEALLEVSLVSTLPMPRMFPALSMHHEQSLQAPGAAMLWDTRRRRGVDAPNPSPCIEIAHPRSGARFLLSRENGVWLLSFHAASATGSVDLQSFVATLRTHFARQGLGPIDIIVDDSVNQT